MAHLAVVITAFLALGAHGFIWDPCANYQCANGGHCTAPADAPYCDCPVGFTGTHCTIASHIGKRIVISRDPCVNYHCENGGICTAPADAPYCLCPVGFAGNRCQSTLV
ncbi:sushi nidogen and EGF-like domain-containing protein 1 [Biomphalaria pfeifferi]|uniref:Sushi nidogen and EGF-like domain-containing protein 1 n=1 Tax=Biomphalaria pfeifferi TaxID=112525 RepID=A0AAD8F8M8_BIOPF|nr:sushi nidogen and EGF-like domain-containing protein 1 [Biomphalaria pfeifferi]